jgi:hypothetical protein
MKGMGKYSAIEAELNNLSADELNELFLNGDLDKIYDDFERTGEVNVRKAKATRKKKKRKVKGE